MNQEQEVTMNQHDHILIIFYPIQGHINPALQLAKNLVRAGAKVTLGTTANRGLKQIKSLPTLKGLSFASILDDQNEDISATPQGVLSHMENLQRVGPENLTNLLQKLSANGEPVTLLIYSLILPWAATVARDVHVPSVLFFNQNATALAIYHHFFNSKDGVHGESNSSLSLEISGLPLFYESDIPTIFLPDNPFSVFMISVMKEHIKVLEEDPKSLVLVNTVEEFEQESIKATDTMNVISIGPLIPSAFCDGEDVTDKSFGGDLFDKSEDYSHWLDSKTTSSVIYVSFGSLAVLKKEQKEEIFHALVESNRPFFWVLRSSNNEEEDEVNKTMKNELNGDGMIVEWCSQVEVLSHPSVGCFVTHCGWNSTLESLVSGVPIIGCPQFSEQTTNAKMVEEVWGVGVRVRANEERVIERGELKKCLDIVMGDGDRRKEIREKAGKLRALAIKAVKEGGSTCNNFKRLLEITQGSTP